MPGGRLTSCVVHNIRARTIRKNAGGSYKKAGRENNHHFLQQDYIDCQHCYLCRGLFRKIAILFPTLIDPCSGI
jgi:hypothetical protein